jgi:hypothetical protein
MSTRCQVRVISEGMYSAGGVTLYHHCDGYPSGMLPLFAEAFAKFGKGWEAGREGKVAAFLCAADPGGFEPEAGHDLHGDIEYYYKLFAVNKHGGSTMERPRWEVEVYQAGSMKLLHPRCDVTLLADKGRAIEESERDEDE